MVLFIKNVLVAYRHLALEGLSNIMPNNFITVTSHQSHSKLAEIRMFVQQLVQHNNR